MNTKTSNTKSKNKSKDLSQKLKTHFSCGQQIMHYINHQQSSFFHHAMALILDCAPPPTTTTTRDVLAPEIKNFKYTHQFDHGSLTVRAVAGRQEKEQSNKLLFEAFEEMTSRRARLKQKLIRLRAAVSGTYYRPNSVTLVGFYKASGAADGQEAIVGTVEVWFDVVESFVTPDVPNGATYVCNLTVRGDMRRKGIGWQLLKACEELICKVNGSRDVYLHCRVVDTGPYKMYKKAEYKVAKTDNFLIWLTLQRRKHLMHKQLKCE